MEAKSNQVVEVKFPSGEKTYSYIGNGNLRVGQQIGNAPVNHHISGKAYTSPVKVVATHQLVGAEVGDKKGITNGKVHSIGTGLKYLPGTREQQQNRQIDIGGEKVSVSDYMSNYQSASEKRIISRGSSFNADTTKAEQRLLGV